MYKPMYFSVGFMWPIQVDTMDTHGTCKNNTGSGQNKFAFLKIY